jgi:hypothetical protein
MQPAPKLSSLTISKSEAIMILDALSTHHLHIKQRGSTDEQVATYCRLVDKICALLGKA